MSLLNLSHPKAMCYQPILCTVRFSAPPVLFRSPSPRFLSAPRLPFKYTPFAQTRPLYLLLPFTAGNPPSFPLFSHSPSTHKPQPFRTHPSSNSRPAKIQLRKVSCCGLQRQVGDVAICGSVCYHIPMTVRSCSGYWATSQALCVLWALMRFGATWGFWGSWGFGGLGVWGFGGLGLCLIG